MRLRDMFRFGRKDSDPLAIWAEMLRAGVTAKTGQTVNLENAFRVSVFFACLRVLSQGVAQVPFKLFQETEQGGLKKINPARTHPLYDLLATAPNDWTTSYEFRETMVLHAALGDAFVYRNRGALGRGLKEFILLNPARVKPEQLPDWSIIYKVTGADGVVQQLTQEDIWHVRGPSWNGFCGIQTLQIAREALGLTMSLDESVANLHKEGVRPSGLYTVDGTLSTTQQTQIETWLKKQAAAPGAPMILDRGAKWVPQVMTSVDAQHLEMRKQQVEEVCRFTGVSPHKVFSTDKTSTYASAEQFNIQHVVDTLGPWYARIEQSADLHLLTKKERQQGYYFRFNANGLLRGAVKERGDYYAKALGSGGHPGWMSPDEVRELEEMNPQGGEAAKLPPSSSQAQQASKGPQ
jgi:HK97 family phage portal protein